MEELKPNKILRFNPNQLAEVRKVFGYADVRKVIQDIDTLENWITKQNHFIVKDFGREYLERFLIYNKGSVERAKKHLDRFCTLRNLMPEFLKNFDVKNEFDCLFHCTDIAVVPTPTVDNYRVVGLRTYGDRDDVTLLTYYRYVIVFVEYMLMHDYCQGYVIVFDTREIPFGMVTKLNPIIFHKAIMLIEETLAQRVKGMHFVTGSKFFDTILTLVRKGVSEKLKNRIHIHSDFEAIRKFVPDDMMPRDFGGKEKGLRELMKINLQELSSDEHIARVKFMETAATDENKRLSSNFNEQYSGLPGSFKTLSVD